MDPTLAPTHEALRAVLALLRRAGSPFRLVGGLAVVHHGYARYTADVDVLVTREGSRALDPLLEAHGFERAGPRRLTHTATGVRVDLLREGDVLHGRRRAPLPSPADVPCSESDPNVIGLAPLVSLKLDAGRAQDIADLVELLKPLDDGAYLVVEAAVRVDQRSELVRLRESALEELRWAELDET